MSGLIPDWGSERYAEYSEKGGKGREKARHPPLEWPSGRGCSSDKRHGSGEHSARCPLAIVNKTGNDLPGCGRLLDLRFRARLRNIMQVG